MGVIRWVDLSVGRKVEVEGYLGARRICKVVNFGERPAHNRIFRLIIETEFPRDRVEFGDGWLLCDSVEDGKSRAEDILYDWMEEAGLASQEDLDAARDALAEYGEEVMAMGYLEQKVDALKQSNEDLKKEIEYANRRYATLHETYLKRMDHLIARYEDVARLEAENERLREENSVLRRSSAFASARAQRYAGTWEQWMNPVSKCGPAGDV
ncbi:hypothetical protein [Gellertiella hungarica]|uniref:Putative RNase H-like nuclease (RuvC/YqgF family) n=1 Tax=Gellertiella hungarica TaxID=1572859 RepID=A0A7W6J3E1_9HYPH|nr:hypothetical protein [Gellertiella hungarica]MBB4064034.1 putative RNase H-like nuclease (RuvC/YqgF family) [Gellertiella hungarica]